MSLSDYQNSYQVSPIILVGGIAGTGMLPVVSLLNAQSYPQGITGSPDPDNPPGFGSFRPLAGHTLMDNEGATYPLANQQTAANAIITNPLRISLEMIVPADGNTITLANKLSIITALKSSLDNHTAQGGWYNVATPSYIYQGCLLLTLVDATEEEEGGQPQVRWIWNFMQPLITLAQAQAAQNQAMAKISGQTQNSGDPPGSQPVTTGIGQPSANIVQNQVPAASGPIGSNIAPAGMPTGVTNIQSVSPISPGS